jgi:LacI family transcriptional regulator
MTIPGAARPQKVTLKFLSQLLGLSKTTISVVLNNSPHAKTIAQGTRERVFAAAKEHNYRPNFIGRSLNDGRSYLIGVICPDLSEGYNSSLLAGIEHAMLDTEYQFFVASHHWSETRMQKTAQLFSERNVEGVILVNSPFMPEMNLPAVYIGRHDIEPVATTLSVDNHAGTFAAMRHLVELGHRRIAFLRGHQGSVDSADRWEGVLAAAQQLSIPVQPALTIQLERMGVLSQSAMEEGACCADKLVSRPGRFSAVMAFNDMSAIGAITRFRAVGLRVPEDVSVVGFDDIVEAQIIYPALTTVRQPLRVMGARAAGEMIASITGEPVRQTILFEPELIVRASTAPAATSRSMAANR